MRRTLMAVVWVLGSAGGLVLAGAGRADAAGCETQCHAGSSCGQQCFVDPAEWPRELITCGEWFQRTGQSYWREVGRGEARWIDAHVHHLWHVDFWTGTYIRESNCYQERDQCVDPVWEHSSVWNQGSTAGVRQSLCNWWGCTGHGHAYSCRPCEGICL
jgi:hypothetical protein